MSYSSVLSYIEDHQDETVQLLQELVRIPSVNPPGNEEEVAKLVSQELEVLGFEVEHVIVEPGRPNVIARLPGTKDTPRLVCYAHLDVVPAGRRDNWDVDPFSGDRIGDRIFGRGTIDHKSPIASLIAAVQAIQANDIKLHGELLFTFVSDEENIGEKGMRFLAKHKLISADLGLYCTHTAVKSEFSRQITPWMSEDNILIAHNGKLHIRLVVKGRTTHTMSLESGINAIEKSGPVLVAISQLAREVNQRTHPLTGRARMSINVIKGGDKDNILPDCCVIDIDRRYTPAESSEKIIDELEAVLQDLRQNDPKLSIEIEIVRDEEPSSVPETLPLVQTVKSVYSEATGRTPRVTGLAATADSKWFINHLGIPMVMVGCGDLYRAHQPNEYITVAELEETTKVYAMAILEIMNANADWEELRESVARKGSE